MCVLCEAAMTVAAAVGSVLPGVPVPDTPPITEKPPVAAAAADVVAAAVSPSALTGKCVRMGQTRTVKGVRYVCNKSKRWQVASSGTSGGASGAVSTTSSTSTTTTTVRPSISYSPPTQAGSDLASCMIREQNANRERYSNALPSGFPRKTIAKKEGTVKWALIPIDFPDLIGQANFRSRVDDQMSLLSEWFTVASEGKFKVEWVVHNSWVRLPSPTAEYQIERSENLDRVPNGLKLWRDAMTQSDKVFNFSGVQTVNFLLPSGQNFVQETSQGFPWDDAVKNFVTEEGTVESFSLPGKFFDQLGRQYWSYWMHEFGHAMGFPHIGSSREENPFMGLDIMSNQDGESRELSGWLRFVAGWLPDERVYCQDFSGISSAEVTLIPLSESPSGVKMVVVPVSKTKAVVIESRRESKFSCTMPSKRNGVLVYVYDATLSHGENFLRPVGPGGRDPESGSNCLVARFPNPILYRGEKVVAEGVTVEVLESLNFDKVRVTKG